MNSFLAFFKKDWMEQLRSAKFWILLVIFIVFGVMNPVNAKLTPWLMELMKETLEESGIAIENNPVTAIDSWAQFYKNISMALIIFIVLESNIFTKEYRSGTLVLALTKGLERRKVLMSKTLVLVLLWSLCYWICYLVTYIITAILWDSSIVQHPAYAAMCWWLLGLLAVMLTVLFSTVTRASASVMGCTMGVYVLMYLVTLVPKYGEWSPAALMNSASLLVGNSEIADFNHAIGFALGIMLLCFIAAIPILNKKQI